MAIRTPNLISNYPLLSSLIKKHPNPLQISSSPLLPTNSPRQFPSITPNSYRNRRTFIYSSNQQRESVLDYIGEEGKTDLKQSSMTIGSAVHVSGRRLVAKGRTILTEVAENVITSSGSESGRADGVFVGAVFEEESSRQTASLGKLHGVRFMACFRFKLWWMAQKMGVLGSEIPLETQFLLMETIEDDPIYVVFLPLIEGSFRSSLQGSHGGELEVCLESGDPVTKGSGFSHSVYVGAGSDPFATVTDALATVKSHLDSFKLRCDKKLPGIVDYFGWCTWDAFYQSVTQEGVESGLESLAAGGTPAKFVIIDDGWQSVGPDSDQKPDDSQEPLLRLTAIKENEKFRTETDPVVGIKNIVDIAKRKYGLKYVYVWHAIVGYWGGVRPGAEGMEEYGSTMKYPVVSKGVMANEPGWKTDMLAVQGLGLMNPKKVFKFYDELHGYLAAAGVDGVKVDVQSILETLGTGLGGRVAVTRQYHQALDASIARNFPDNGCIACMSHNTDALYCSQQTAVVRASDDFYPRDPVSHTIHIASVAYNSVFLGEFMQPDWDMFHSLHPAADYHASARAISGGPIYVSDAPGKHDFDLLKKLVLPDGSVLRARYPGRPTKDCLFTDPTRDGVSLLKIWNMNKYTGVIGVYNCQGAAWNAAEWRNTFHETRPDSITGSIRPRDVHLIGDAAVGPDWCGDCAVYHHRTGSLVSLRENGAIPVTLNVLEHEIFTVVPIEDLGSGLGFGPLGLIDMFNSGGAVEEVKYVVERGGSSATATVVMKVKGCGRFGAYSTAKPRRCTVGPGEVGFLYDSESGLVLLDLDHMAEDGKYHDIIIHLYA